MKGIVFEPAHVLARSIRNREISSVEVVNAFLKHIETHNSELNAIITVNREKALKQAELADKELAGGTLSGPLHGVPITFKDAFETEGIRTTAGNESLKDHIPDTDAAIVSRLKKAGAIILGKTNMPDLAQDLQTENKLFGFTKNPWNKEFTSGGSSGGEASAVAAGLSPLGIGSDIGGSVRIPSHYCGLYAIKPTEGLVPNSGHIPPKPGSVNSIRNLMSCGPMARSVEDLKIVLQIISGPDSKDRNVYPVSLEKVERKELKECRILWTDSFGDLLVTKETSQAVTGFVRNLEDAGCHVEKLVPERFNFNECWKTYGELFGHMLNPMLPYPAKAVLKRIGPLIGTDVISRATFKSLNSNSSSYLESLAVRDKLGLEMEEILSGFDAFLCPVSSAPAFKRRKMGNVHEPVDVDGVKIPGNMVIGYTSVFNVTGHPVVTMPLARTGEGLPIGVQVVGKMWNDMNLLDISGMLADITEGFVKPEGY